MPEDGKTNEESTDEGYVEIGEESPDVVDKLDEDQLREDGVTETEIEKAKEHGLLKEEVEEENKEEVEEKPKEEVKEKEDLLETLDSFEKVHDVFVNKPEEFRKFPKYVKALYHNSKGLYKQAKSELQRRQSLESESELNAVKNKGALIKLDRIKETLKKENLTVEDLEAIINDVQEKQEEKVEPEKEEGLSDEKAKYVQEKLQDAEQLGRVEVDHFDEVLNIAQEVVNEKPRYRTLLQQALIDEETSEKDVVDLVVDIAKLSDKYKDLSEPKEEDKKTVSSTSERIIKNSEKKPSSASVGSGGGRVKKSYAELTPEDAVNMSNEDFMKIPDEHRRRLLHQ